MGAGRNQVMCDANFTQRVVMDLNINNLHYVQIFTLSFNIKQDIKNVNTVFWCFQYPSKQSAYCEYIQISIECRNL